MDLLQVKGNQIVDGQGRSVRLRGVCVGGWMNMEEFINGYPGSEHGQRAAMAKALGEEKGNFFFERMLDYFLTEADLAFLKSLGATVVRLALNYRHFEQDERPFSYLEAGFARLDQAIDWCAKNDLYAILDLHSVQGWKNTAGTATIPPGIRSSGSSLTSRIASWPYVNSSPAGIRTIRQWRGIT